MNRFDGKKIWLVGASEGLGRELARELARGGARLYLSARNVERLNSLASELPDAKALPCDVTDADSMAAAAAEISSLDGVIYNAGAYEPLNTAHWDTETAIKMNEVNYVGALRVIGLVLPDFLAVHRGEITLVGSLAGYSGLPNAIGYGASKAAIVSLAETMRHDLKNTGVTIRLVNPGFIKTRLTEKNEFRMPMLMSAEDAAKRVVRAMQSKRFRTDFPAPFSWLLRALDYLPDILVYRGK